MNALIAILRRTIGRCAKTAAKPTVKALFCLLLLTILFYWKILLTHEFSLLTGREGVNQAYAWLDFWVASIRHGVLPLWDPYTWTGHSFIGEMQTAAFYPLHLLLALVPFNRYGVLSPQLYNDWFAFAHFLGACFMFALVRELGLRRFPALVAGICFAFGGFVSNAEWPHLFESAIWLPLIFLFILRALRAEDTREALRNASISGLFVGLSILAGGLHVVIMQALVVASAAVFAVFEQQVQGKPFRGRSWTRPALAVFAVAVVGGCVGAVQLLPSMEYSGHALRWLGPWGPLPATQTIPYAYLSDSLWPHGFVGMLIPTAFGGRQGVGEVVSPYLGVFPLLAAVIGIWKCWSNAWVRYLTALAAAAFLYSLGSFSFLHGILYVLVPRLWMAREASRFLYLADFALPILAAFGIEVLLCEQVQRPDWTVVKRILTGIVIAGAIALAVPALYGHPEINPWISLSILLVFLSYGLFLYILRGHTGRPARILIVGLALFDLNAFHWPPRNKIELGRTGTDYLDRALSCRGAANFLKSRPGPFRVRILAKDAPNIGDLFQVHILGGSGVTLTKDYAGFMGHTDLLNARYLLKPATAAEPGAVYQDSSWKVYEDPSAFPAAWIVHETVVEPSRKRLLALLDSPAVDPRRQALLSEPLRTSLEPRLDTASEDVTFDAYKPGNLELKVHAGSRGLLVLSENFYPGWEATVNGNPTTIYKVDGALRGVVIPSGDNRIIMRYAPRSVFVGLWLSLAAFSGTLAAFVLTRRVG